MTPPRITFEWLDERHLEGLIDLFARDGSPCYCRYWHFEDDNKAWLARCAGSPETNRDELRRDVRERELRATGLLALDGDLVVGWMKLVPRSTVPKLRSLPTYRAYDLGPDEGVWSIGCFLIDENYRKQGLARALVEAAITHVRVLGARALEAYPREGLHAQEAWTGPPSVFAGFTRVAGEKPYPVLRLDLPESK